MQYAKVVSEIEAMDGRERERLRQFVHSPYFNTHAPTARLLDYVLKELRRKRPRLGTEELTKFLAPASAPDTLSALMKLLNRFLAVEEMAEEPFVEERLLLRRSARQHRNKLLENRAKRLRRQFVGYPYRDAPYHLAGYEVNRLTGDLRTETRRKHIAEFQHMLDHLDRYWLVEKLRHACHFSANRVVMNVHYDLHLIDEIVAFLGGDAGAKLREEEPGIDCYYRIYLSIHDVDNPLHYERMGYYLGPGLDSIPPDERKDLLIFATNYCIDRIKSGQNDYRRELLNLYRRALDSGIIYTDTDEITEWDFKNIVTIGSATGELSWTEAFIESHRERLPATVRDNVYALNKARFLYSAGRLDEAAELLIGVRDHNVQGHLARVLLQVQIAYAQVEDEFALNLLEAFRLYVHRNANMTVADKRSYNNFIRLARQLINLRLNWAYSDPAANQRRLNSLNDAVRDTKLLHGRGWLAQQSGQLQNSPV